MRGESPHCAYLLHGGPPRVRNILIVPRQRAQGMCFSDLRHSEALENFFTDQAHYEKRSSTAKGLLLGVCFVTEGPVRRNTFEKINTEATPKVPSKELRHNDTSQDEGSHRLKDKKTDRPMIICVMIIICCKGHKCNFT
jgi:hypothetical protein